nr:hypothetical protein GCM10025699_15210 [Microbacterium flavescens]
MLAELDSRGLRVPEDVSVISVGASFDLSTLTVPVDSIPLVPEESCDLAVDLALEMLGPDRPEPGLRLIPPVYEARGTIAAPRPPRRREPRRTEAAASDRRFVSEIEALRHN